MYTFSRKCALPIFIHSYINVSIHVEISASTIRCSPWRPVDQWGKTFWNGMSASVAIVKPGSSNKELLKLLGLVTQVWGCDDSSWSWYVTIETFRCSAEQTEKGVRAHRAYVQDCARIFTRGIISLTQIPIFERIQIVMYEYVYQIYS